MVESKSDTKMIYRYLGKTGLRVSVLSFGNMVQVNAVGDKQTPMTEAVKRCLEHGINFFDTAELYGFGEAEVLLGQALIDLKVKREEVVLTTKLFYGAAGKNGPAEHFAFYQGMGINQVGLSRKHIIEGTKGALKRLQQDYVDVIFAHRPDIHTPLEETCRAFSWVIDQGMAHYWGTSEWDADTIVEAIQLCQKLGLHAPVAEQSQYNMVERNNIEKSYRALFEKYGYGTTVFSPMAGGFLSGRYNDGVVPEDSRYKNWDFWGPVIESRYFTGANKEKILKACRGLAELAKELGYSQAVLALAWVIASNDVSTLILGFSKLSHLEENVKALELYSKWNKELEDKVEAILANGPEPSVDFRKFAPR